MVDDDGVAGEGKVPGKDDDAVRRGAGRVAGDGVELGGVGAGTLLAVRDLDLTEIQQDEIVLGRADEPAGPELFPHRQLIQRPDVVPELGVRDLGGGRPGLDFRSAEVFGQNGQRPGERLPVDRDADLVGSGGGVVGRRDVGPPAGGAAGARNTAEVGLQGGGRVPGHAGDGNAYDASLLDPLSRKLDVGAGLQREPKGEPIPAGRPGRVLLPPVLMNGAVGAALELGGRKVGREPPDCHRSLVAAVGREEEVFILPGRTGEHEAADVGLDGQGGVGGPVGQGECRVGIVQCAQLLHGKGVRLGKDPVEHTAHQRHLPAGAVHFQCLPAELYVRRRAGPLAGKGIAHGHYGPQQHDDAQRDADDPKKKSLHDM